MTSDHPPRTLGPYQIVGEVAHGGMATVYRALQPNLGRYVALKVLSAELSYDPDFVARFQHEARVAARLEHPNIVPIYDIGQTDGAFYIAMRLVPGRSLADIITTDGPVPLERARQLLNQVAGALDYAHRQGVVHRDVKPSNMLVEDNDHLSLADFGIARATDASRVTRFGMLVGTPRFMAPEQVQGLDIDYRADLYSLGVVAYLMLTGQAPFEADSVVTLLHKHVYEAPPSARALRPELPEHVDAALSRMLAKQPGERYPSAAAFVTALHAQRSPDVTVDEPIRPAPQPSATGQDSPARSAPSSTPVRRSSTPWPIIVASVLLVTAVGIAAVVVRQPLALLSDPPTPTPGQPTPRATSSATRAPVTPAGLQVPTAGVALLTQTPSAPRPLPGTWEILAGDPTAAGFFNGPAGVAVDQQGNVFVSELLNHRIQKLSPTGQAVAQWGTFGAAPGQFRDPNGLSVDGAGNLYVADRSNNRIQKLGPDGAPLAQFGGSGQLSGPIGVALDAQGNIYVTDSGNNRIAKFSSSGQILQQWGVYGEGPGQFATPAGIAVDAQGIMYVADEGNDRVQKLAPDGQALAQWGASVSSTTDASQQLTFSGPVGLVLDSAGNLLVTDSGGNRVVKLSPEGTRLAEWGGWGSGPGEFETPAGIALDPQGNLVVVDHDNDRVQKLSADGKPVTQWGSERTPPRQFRQAAGVAVDGQASVYVVDKNNQRIQKLSATGNPLALWGTQGVDPGQFSVPAGVAMDGQGNVLVTDSGNTRIQRFAMDGHLVSFWGSAGEGPGQLESPAGIAADPQGTIYVVDSDANRIVKFSSSGQFLMQWGEMGSKPGEFLTPVGIALGSDGSVYVGDQGNYRIQKFSPTGQPLKQWGASGSDHGQFQQIEGLAIDGRGNVLVADAGNNRLYQFSADGQLLTESGARGMSAGQFQGPAGVAVDASGAIYVSEMWNHRVQRLKPSP
jgi:serine/threonine protein kinase/DNA-binding beta-propeller fold protein YncE